MSLRSRRLPPRSRPWAHTRRHSPTPGSRARGSASSASSCSRALSSATTGSSTTARRRRRALSDCIERLPRLVFEAHSTDYQTPDSLAALVRDHFAILKVGPAVTFALREAVWALDAIEREWHGESESSRVRETLLEVMRADPSHWRKYYHGTGRSLALQLEYSLSDRIRYYWPQPSGRRRDGATHRRVRLRIPAARAPEPIPAGRLRRGACGRDLTEPPEPPHSPRAQGAGAVLARLPPAIETTKGLRYEDATEHSVHGP